MVKAPVWYSFGDNCWDVELHFFVFFVLFFFEKILVVKTIWSSEVDYKQNAAQWTPLTLARHNKKCPVPQYSMRLVKQIFK